MNNRVFGFLLSMGMLLTSYSAVAQTFKIMPLGNSITQGKGDPGTDPGVIYDGFRNDLCLILNSNNWDYDFVGSQKDGNQSAQFDVDHEGHSGWRADDLLVFIDSWLTTYSPDIILLHIGTNDISNGQSNQSTINEIESIVDKIYNFNERKAILLSKLIPRKPNVDNDHVRTEQLNDLIEQLYNTKKNQGYNIYLVNHWGAFDANPNWQNDWMFDDVHPNNSGYNVMAQTYWSVLQNVELPEELYQLKVTVNPAGSGYVELDPPKDYYSYVEEVQMKAFAFGDYRFSHWSGDITPESTNPRDVTMWNNRNIVANFVNDSGEYVRFPNPPTGPATGTSGTGLTFSTGGAVNSQGHNVEYQFDWGDGFESSWGSATQNHIFYASGTYRVVARARCTVHTNIISSLSAYYEVTITGDDKYLLTVEVDPPGTGTVTVIPDKALYDYNEEVRIEAFPIEDYYFRHWSGSSQRSTNPDIIRMGQNRTIIANFRSGSGDEFVNTPNKPTGPNSGSPGFNLTFETGGSTSSLGYNVEYLFDWGDGDISDWGGSVRTHKYNSDGVYVVKAKARSEPNPTVESPDWSAGLTVTIETSVTNYNLTVLVNPNGAGTVTKNPDMFEYPENSVVTLTATGSDGGDPVTDKVYLEGEMGVLSGPMAIGTDSEASADQYITCTSNVAKSGQAEYYFDIEEEGTYVIWGRCNALGGTEDSFFMVMDQNADTLAWHLKTPWNSWVWQKISHDHVVQDFNLTVGSHQISILSREKDARLDKLILSKDPAFQPSGVELSPNQPYAFTHWTGDLTGSNSPATVVMNRNKEITANFEVVNETVNPPNTPSGLTNGRTGKSLSFTTGGSSSNVAHEVEYKFDWGDGSQSDWGYPSGYHVYSSAGDFELKAMARCKTHTNIVSGWSNSLLVTITVFYGYTLDIEISPPGAGSVNKDPFKTQYEENEEVEVKAIPYRADNNIRLEAESGQITGNIAVGASSDASGGKYIYGTPGAPQDGSVEYIFNILEAGTYYIWGRCFALSDTRDSFFIEVDGSPSLMRWDLEQTYYTWLWQKVNEDNVQDFYFNVGQHTLKVVKRDEGVQLDKFLITNDPSYEPEGKEETMELRIEAESGVLESPITTGDDSEASGGQFIHGTSGDAEVGSAEYTFQIAEAGIYVIWGRCYALSQIEDSFFIQVDGNANLLWKLNQTYNIWKWQIVNDDEDEQDFYLDVGQHTLKVIKRENNARLDKIIITKDLAYEPVGKEEGAAPSVNYRFDHWSGDMSGNSNPVSFLMNSSKSITAHFIETNHLITSPTNLDGPATTVVGEQVFFSTYGATSSQGDDLEYQFDWGDGKISSWTNGANNHIYYSMGAKSVRARARSTIDTSAVSSWSEESVTIVVSGLRLHVTVDPSGGGQVSKNPNQTEYAYGDTVALTAEANGGFVFGNWGGNLSGTNNSTKIVMDATKSVTAVFMSGSGLNLSVLIDPPNSGQVMKNPNKTVYTSGDTVTLAAEANSGFLFANWSGDLSGNDNPTEIVLDANKSITATFMSTTETIDKPTILTGPNNGFMGQTLSFTTSGATNSSGHEIEYMFSWGDGSTSVWGNGTSDHRYETMGIKYIQSKARCKQHPSIISSWSDTLSVTIDGYSISIGVNPQNYGYVNKNPNKQKYASGDSIIVFAGAYSGYEFIHWSGDLTGNTNPDTIVADANKNVLANFERTQETITKPGFINGPDSGIVDQSLPFVTGGSLNNLGNPVEYRFDWGNSTESEWVDSSSSYAYQTVGTKQVRTQARSKVNTGVISGWSEIHQLTIISKYFTLETSVDPLGKECSINVYPPQSEYELGDVVTLNPIAGNGYVFVNWSGDIVGSSYTVHLIIDGNKKVTAHFRLQNAVEEEKQVIPNNFALKQNFPNPFNPETLIWYQLPKSSNVSINIYNVQGQLIYNLVDEKQPAGYYQTRWLAIDNSGNKVPSGVYLYQLKTEHYFDVKKMILLK
jgi:lysophospholipase L1-like esterase